jgi:hypothetical protein
VATMYITLYDDFGGLESGRTILESGRTILVGRFWKVVGRFWSHIMWGVCSYSIGLVELRFDYMADVDSK